MALQPSYTAAAIGSNAGPVLVYDGLCVMCNAAVQFVLRHDRASAILFAPLQGEYARRLKGEHTELETVDSILFVVPDDSGGVHISTKSDAVIAVSRYLRAGRVYATMLRLFPRPLRNAVYDVVAKVRYQAFGRYASCPVVPNAVRERFLA